MKMRHLAVVLLLSFTAVALFGQIIAGDLGSPDAALGGASGSAVTLLDLSHPVSAPGALTKFTLLWSSSNACSGLRLRVFRGTLMVAERGPFTMPSTAGYASFDLTPAVDVLPGDTLAVFMPAACGFIGVAYGDPNEMLVRTSTNYTGGALPGDWELIRGERLNVRATGGTFGLVGIVPAVGALPGSNGALFRTTIQMSNATGFPIKPQIVYHPAGRSAADADPIVAVPLTEYATKALEFSDTFAVTGLGSLDVLGSTDTPPTVNARVYNDTGSGTNGFNEPMIPVSAALHGGEYGVIIFPSDPVNFRMNVGVRTLSRGATLSITAAAANGQVLPGSTKTYAPNYFEQTSMQLFLGQAPPANGIILFQVVGGGDAIVYVTTTDNRTNDSAMTIVTRR